MTKSAAYDTRMSKGGGISYRGAQPFLHDGGHLWAVMRPS